MGRLTAALQIERVRAIVRDLDSALDPAGFARLYGSSSVSDVYRTDLAGAENSRFTVTSLHGSCRADG